MDRVFLRRMVGEPNVIIGEENYNFGLWLWI